MIKGLEPGNKRRRRKEIERWLNDEQLETLM